MPKQLGTILNHACTVAGIKAENADLVAILTNPELSKINIPDDIANAIEQNLFSADSAKAKFFAQWKAEDLNGFDAHAIRMAEGLKFSPEEIEELKGIKGSSKKLERYTELLAAKKLEEAKAQYSGKDADRQKLIDDMNTLKLAQAEKERAYQKQLEDLAAANESQITTLQARTFLSQYADRFNLPKEMDADMKIDFAMQAIQKEAATKGISFKRNGNNIEVVDANGAKYFENSIEQSYKHIVESTLSRNNLLKTVTDPPPVDPNRKTPGAGGNNNADFISKLDAEIAALESKG
jgi:hypothetical protein